MAPRTEKTIWKQNKHWEVSVPDPCLILLSPKWNLMTVINCPIHRKLRFPCKCHAFNGKAIEDCKTFSKENNMCFKCYSSSSHITRDYKINSEFKVERHHSALPWTQEVDPAPEHSGEEEETSPQSQKNCMQFRMSRATGHKIVHSCLNASRTKVQLFVHVENMHWS